MIGAIIGGLSAVASGISAVQNMNSAKRADESAKNFTNKLMNLQEQNAYKGLQVPDIQKLQQDYINRSQTQSIDALQSAGPEAVLGGVSAVNQNAIDAGAQTAQDQAALMAQRDQQVAQAQQGVNERQALRQGEVLASQATGAGLAAANSRNNANNAVAGIFSSLGGVATDIMGNEKFDYGFNQNKQA
jgi:Tfp pilus assembly PilM family ATPase